MVPDKLTVLVPMIAVITHPGHPHLRQSYEGVEQDHPSLIRMVRETLLLEPRGRATPYYVGNDTADPSMGQAQFIRRLFKEQVMLCFMLQKYLL